MTTTTIKEFLESSTIHGLVHFSTAKSRAARLAWVAIVVASFAFAIREITNALQEWRESPVSTTITTHPITELEFPEVTVCPPRGSNTALNHLLEKVKDVNFTGEEKKELLEISKEVFLEIPNKEHAQKIRDPLSVENMRSIANGQASMPEVDKEGVITIRSSEPEGSFSFPAFGDPEYTGDFHSRPQSLHYVLDLPDNIGEMVGEGELVISVETEGSWSFISPENKWQLYKKNMSWSDAEDYCVREGGHLASVTSQREQDQITKVADGNRVWLGGRRKSREDAWQWSDGRSWGFNSTWFNATWNRQSVDCLVMLSDRKWLNFDCIRGAKFICTNPPTRTSGNHTLVLRKTSLLDPTFHFWWNNTTERSLVKGPAFKIDWTIQNVSHYYPMEFVSKDMSGNISTPGLGFLPPPNRYKERHEYTAVIELPHNITDVIGDGALVVDVDVTVPDNMRRSGMELLTGEEKLEYNNMKMNWSAAEEFCVSKGGHLASVASPFHWHKLQSFIADNFLYFESIWLGGTYEAREGEWAWTDGSKWSEEHWSPGWPSNTSDQNCLDSNYGEWYDDRCQNNYSSICSVPTRRTLTSDTQLVFTSENISMTAIKVRWVSLPITQEEDENGEMKSDSRKHRKNCECCPVSQLIVR